MKNFSEYVYIQHKFHMKKVAAYNALQTPMTIWTVIFASAQSGICGGGVDPCIVESWFFIWYPMILHVLFTFIMGRMRSKALKQYNLFKE